MKALRQDGKCLPFWLVTRGDGWETSVEDHHMQFSQGDYIAAGLLMVPAIGWSWIYPIGVMRFGWNRFSRKAMFSMSGTISVAVVGLVSIMAGTWMPALVMSPLIVAACSTSCWLGVWAARRILSSLDAESDMFAK